MVFLKFFTKPNPLRWRAVVRETSHNIAGYPQKRPFLRETSQSGGRLPHFTLRPHPCVGRWGGGAPGGPNAGPPGAKTAVFAPGLQQFGPLSAPLSAPLPALPPAPRIAPHPRPGSPSGSTIYRLSFSPSLSHPPPIRRPSFLPFPPASPSGPDQDSFQATAIPPGKCSWWSKRWTTRSK